VLYLIQQGVLSVADADVAVSYGPGPRWGVMGPTLQWHLGGGRGGIHHFMEHLMGPMETWEGLTGLIESIGLPVRTFGSALEFLAGMPLDAEGCVVLDINMPGMNGLELQREMNASGISLPIIFLTGHGDIPTTVHALKAGAVHFLTKPVREDELVTAIRSFCS